MIALTRRLTRTLSALSVALAVTAFAMPADARSAGGRSGKPHNQINAGRGHARIILSGMVYRGSYGGGGLQCVPFARENSGIELTGNAANWWAAADGVYERGARPEVGSVLNFRANGRMRLGHVAVVSNVVDSRNVEIDHANWSGRGAIGRNVRVVDVSAANDWSAVRVALSRGDYGSVYPTFGFIYDRPDKGIMVANNGMVTSPSATQSIQLNRPQTTLLMAAARDLRAPADRIQLAATEEQEVAEAPEDYTARGRRSRSPSYASRAHVVRGHAGATRSTVRGHERRSSVAVVTTVAQRSRSHATPAKVRHRS